MRSTVCSALCSLLSLVLYTVSLDLSQIQVYPEHGGVSGVFIAMPKNKIYSFNATTAREVCEALNVRIATRAEVQKANSKGLQTCRYGWIKEQFAVIPRTEGNQKCGQNKVGVITWTASLNTLFDVFCFNRTVTIIIPTTNLPARSSEARTTSPSLILSTLLNNSILSSSPSDHSVSSHLSTAFTSIPSAFSSLPTRSAPSVPHTSDQEQHSTSSSYSVTFSSTLLSSLPFTLASSVTFALNQTEEPTQLPLPPRALGEVLIGCITIAVILLVATTAGVICYFKIKRSPPWVRIRHKDITDTEMWKHTDLQCPSNCDEITLQTDEDTEWFYE